MSQITNDEYIKILEFYQKPIPKSKRLLKMAAEKIMASKLCRCIKKIEPENEARSIGICTKTIFYYFFFSTPISSGGLMNTNNTTKTLAVVS